MKFTVRLTTDKPKKIRVIRLIRVIRDINNKVLQNLVKLLISNTITKEWRTKMYEQSINAKYFCGIDLHKDNMLSV
ncbi:hypothetical protein MASR2M39_05040 [Ignavibacteriales bacterium]